MVNKGEIQVQVRNIVSQTIYQCWKLYQFYVTYFHRKGF